MDPLDNPIWAALTTHQSHFALGAGLARRFPSSVSLHGAFGALTPEAWRAMVPLAHDPVGLFSPEPLEPPPGWTVTRKVELYEMVQQDGLELPPSRHPIVNLTPADLPQISALYEATRPGRRFSPRQHELGGFIGIQTNGQVVAMAGLRLHFPEYREISTVGTLPGHTGLGYATALVADLARRIRATGERPFLTVRTDNPRAIEIYRRLGFRERTILHSTTLRCELCG